MNGPLAKPPLAIIQLVDRLALKLIQIPAAMKNLIDSFLITGNAGLVSDNFGAATVVPAKIPVPRSSDTEFEHRKTPAGPNATKHKNSDGTVRICYC